MPDDATAAVPQEAGKLIGHVLTRHHGMRRADLASVVPLAGRVAQVREMEDHMAKDEMILSLAMRAGDDACMEPPIAVMHADIDDHAETITLENDVLFPRFEPVA
jgi:regulator of cell morphogenesis and NO signaling